MDKRVTPPKRVTSPTWGPHLHVNRPLVKITTDLAGKSCYVCHTQTSVCRPLMQYNRAIYTRKNKTHLTWDAS